ncbi:hypothetical protein [Flexibacterium corallicola]|nr:hypothetical protein [Pseudovibrio sp. M1P-2-3]
MLFKCIRMVIEAMDSIEPDIVFMTGKFRGYAMITVERTLKTYTISNR